MAKYSSPTYRSQTAPCPASLLVAVSRCTTDPLAHCSCSDPEDLRNVNIPDIGLLAINGHHVSIIIALADFRS